MWAEEVGKSERLPVMGKIGVQDLPQSETALTSNWFSITCRHVKPDNFFRLESFHGLEKSLNHCF